MLTQIIGQEPVVRKLREFARLFHGTGNAPDHVMFIGPEGMGKRTIAEAFAAEMGARFLASTGSLLQKKGDLTAVLTSLDPASILLLEDIHRLRPGLKEMLVPALQDFRVDLIIGQGLGARVHPYQLNRFTCLSSVQREGDLTTELRDLFPLILRLQPYTASDLEQIVKLICDKSSISIAPTAAQLIGEASKGSPHQAEVIIRRVARGKENVLGEKDVRDYLSVFSIGTEVASPSGGRGVLDSLSGIDFERLIAALFVRMGFQIEMTKPSGDGGIDIIATLGKPLIGGRMFVQCKRFAIGAPIGAPLVREFYGALTADRKAAKGVFITTSSFTDQAKSFARDLPIELIDREKLQALLDEYGL